jgi:glycosyltransferase involved in cell wall biosynthesis
MEIILIPSSVEPVGVSTHVLNLARLLQDANLLCTVVCPAEGWLSEQLRQEDLPYHVLYISYKPLYFLRSSLNLFLFLWRKKDLQVVHLHGRFPSFVSLLSMVSLRHLQFVVTMHQFYGTSAAGLFGWKDWLETFILRHFIKKICCVSEDLKKEIVKQLGERYSNKIFTIRNWINPVQRRYVAKAEVQAYEKVNYLRIIAAGRLSAEKGFEILIDAMRIVTEKGVKVKCDIFGEGPEREKLVAQINRYDLGANVKLQGVSDMIRYILPQYDLLVISSRIESFGIVALEAYDAGIPVIASNIPGLREIIIPEKTGLLFESDSSESLSFQIIRLAQSHKLAVSLTKNAQKFVKDFYPNKILLSKYLSFYDLNHC